jgi:hypothetical protein
MVLDNKYCCFSLLNESRRRLDFDILKFKREIELFVSPTIFKGRDQNFTVFVPMSA